MMSPEFTYRRERTIMFNDYPDVVTVQDLCKMLNIGRNTAYSLVKSGEIETLRIKNQIRILKKDIIDYLEKSQF